MQILKLKMVLLAFILLALFSANASALRINISHGAGCSENLCAVIAPIQKINIKETDTFPPIVGIVYPEGFIITENNFIDGSGTLRAAVYDYIGVVSCEYKETETWAFGTYDGAYCISGEIIIEDGIEYYFNIRATDAAANVGYGIDRNYVGKIVLVDSSDISDDDLINIGYSFVERIAIGFVIAFVVIVLGSAIVFLARSAMH